MMIYFVFFLCSFIENVEKTQYSRSELRVLLFAMFLDKSGLCCFFLFALLGAPWDRFFQFGALLGPSQIEPDPRQPLVLCKREHRFWKI